MQPIKRKQPKQKSYPLPQLLAGRSLQMPAIDPQTSNLPTIKTCKSPSDGFDGPLPVRFGLPLISVGGCQLASDQRRDTMPEVMEGPWSTGDDIPAGGTARGSERPWRGPSRGRTGTWWRRRNDDPSAVDGKEGSGTGRLRLPSSECSTSAPPDASLSPLDGHSGPSSRHQHDPRAAGR